MPIYTLELIARKEVAEKTWVFSFNKPANFDYKAGQYGGFTLIKPSEVDAGGITRRFSLLSSPLDDYLSIATRLQSSAYKRVLSQLPLGSQIKFAGPQGGFVLHEKLEKPAVLIAGGIGISPFYSMIKHAFATHRQQSLILFYGNTSLATAAFLPELKVWEKQYNYFRFIPTLDKTEEGWGGETGFITSALIKKYLSQLDKPIYYVCGAPIMVNALQTTLAEMNIPPEQIRSEDFPGY